jgi:hypothetical protein
MRVLQKGPRSATFFTLRARLAKWEGREGLLVVGRAGGGGGRHAADAGEDVLEEAGEFGVAVWGPGVVSTLMALPKADEVDLGLLSERGEGVFQCSAF